MRIYKTNISGPAGFLLLAGLIIIGLLAFTFILIAAAVIAGIFIISYIIRKILQSVGVIKKPKIPVVEYSWEEVKEIPETAIKEEKE